MSVVDIHKIKGVRPEFDIYIGRAVFRTEFKKSSKWHNPNLSLEAYEKHIRYKIAYDPKYYNLEELRGKRLGCWCITTDKLESFICHGQILLKLLEEKQKMDSLADYNRRWPYK